MVIRFPVFISITNRACEEVEKYVEDDSILLVEFLPKERYPPLVIIFFHFSTTKKEYLDIYIFLMQYKNFFLKHKKVRNALKYK